MSLLTPAEATALGIGAGLSTEALQAAINEEEAWLARQLGGPLDGERTEYAPLAYLKPHTSVLWLSRPTDEVEVLQGTTDITDEVELRPDGYRVARLPEATRYLDPISIKYTPNDLLEVKRAVRLLLALTLADQQGGGLTSEQIGSYSYQRREAGAAARARTAIVRSLKPKVGATSIRMLSSVKHGLAGRLGR